MSSPRMTDTLKILAIVLTAGVAGCGFQPLYGTTASGVSLNTAMKAVDIGPIPGRVGQKVRNELIFDTTGGGDADLPVYRLEIALRESIENTLVDLTGDPQGQVYQVYTTFRLVRIRDSQMVFEGKSNARAAFDKRDSVFSDVRARRDAEDRAAKTIAEAIRTRLSAYLATAA